MSHIGKVEKSHIGKVTQGGSSRGKKPRWQSCVQTGPRARWSPLLLCWMRYSRPLGIVVLCSVLAVELGGEI